MKNILLLNIISFLLISCDTQDRTPTNQNTSKSDFLVDSLDIDTSKGPLGELYLGDTLILFARYSECGEFGGHKEWLKIFSDDSTLKCQVIYDSVNCDSPTETMTFTRLGNSTFQMPKTAQSATVNYLNELTQMRFSRQEADFHVGNLYSAVVRPSMDWEQDTTYEVWWWDQSLKWTEFQKLKNEIKTTANKK